MGGKEKMGKPEPKGKILGLPKEGVKKGIIPKDGKKEGKIQANPKIIPKTNTKSG